MALILFYYQFLTCCMCLSRFFREKGANTTHMFIGGISLVCHCVTRVWQFYGVCLWAGELRSSPWVKASEQNTHDVFHTPNSLRPSHYPHFWELPALVRGWWPNNLESWWPRAETRSNTNSWRKKGRECVGRSGNFSCCYEKISNKRNLSREEFILTHSWGWGPVLHGEEGMSAGAEAASHMATIARKQKDEFRGSASFLHFIQFRTSTHGMMPSTLEWVFPPQLTQSRNSHIHALMFVSTMNLKLIKLASRLSITDTFSLPLHFHYILAFRPVEGVTQNPSGCSPLDLLTHTSDNRLTNIPRSTLYQLSVPQAGNFKLSIPSCICALPL